ncbi:hypothetical protein BROUX41_000652 [Berkeleyomyces rouxiae]|uniref:uncharacterized protein n=1 Tax=Berkeleyomyces rouxiae TaxID=2035830 RepID=UPI003B7F3FCC
MATHNNLPNGSPSLALTSDQQKMLMNSLAANGSMLDNDPLSTGSQPVQSSSSMSMFPFDYSFQPDPTFDFDFSTEGPSLLADTSLISTHSETGDGAEVAEGSEEADGADGGISGSSSTTGAISSPTKGPEKRSLPDELAEDGDTSQASNKKRESKKPEKVPKKPGRKPLTEEPTTKRKAQNRAAQRAFRERKEKHVRDLEIKVEELQKASDDANDENSTLRSQIERLTDELEQYKRTVQQMNQSTGLQRPRGFGSAAINNMSDISFQFEFPTFGALPSPHQQSSAPSRYSNAPQNSTSSLSTTTSPAVEPNHAFNTNSGPRGQQNLAQFSNVFGSGSSSRAQSKTGSVSNISASGYGVTSSPSASTNSNPGTSSSCGTSPESSNQSPIGLSKTVDTMATIGEETSPMAITNSNLAGLNSLNMNFDWIARQNGGQFDPQLFGEYREPQDNILSMGLDDTGLFDNYDGDFLTPFNTMPTPAQSQTQLHTEAFKSSNLIQRIDEQKERDALAQKYDMPCNQVWDKLQKCTGADFQEFDLDALCTELKQKANCSGKGPVVKQVDFDTILKKYLGSKWPPTNEENCPFNKDKGTNSAATNSL